MKIFVNERYEILSLDIAPQEYEYCLDSSFTRNELFGDLCDVVVKGHKYEPQYELLFNKDGSNARDEKNGELLYKLDDEGNKIPSGYSCYPYIDYQTLMLIQKQYEESRKQTQAFDSQISHLATISGIGVETNISGQTLEELKEVKKAEINAACGQSVCNGVTVELSTGPQHFSLSQSDQLNLFGLQAQLAMLVENAMFHVSYHVTYGNSMKMWIESVKTAEELQEIFYGADIPEEYQSEVLKTYLAQIAAMAKEEEVKR